MYISFIHTTHEGTFSPRLLMSPFCHLLFTFAVSRFLRGGVSVCLSRSARCGSRFVAAEAGWVGGGERRWVMGDGLVHELRYGTEALGLQRDAVSFFPRVFFHSSGFVCHRTMCSGMIFLQR